MLEARRLRLFSSDYQVTLDGQPVALVDMTTFRSRGQFELDGVTYTFQAGGLMGGSYVLESQGRTLARATRERLIPLLYRVNAGDRMLNLGLHAPGRRFTVRHGDRVIGEVRPRRLFSRSALARFDEPLSLPVQVFLLSLVLLYWRRRARASSSGS